LPALLVPVGLALQRPTIPNFQRFIESKVILRQYDVGRGRWRNVEDVRRRERREKVDSSGMSRVAGAGDFLEGGGMGRGKRWEMMRRWIVVGRFEKGDVCRGRDVG
jgi:hypothetical protein